jgi:hypothetical protein
MRVIVKIAVVAGLAVACAACSSSGSSYHKPAKAAVKPTAAEVRETATNYANAALTGTAAEVDAFLPMNCRSKANAEPLTTFRQHLQKAAGMPLDRIQVTSVQVRKLKGASGEAEVGYNLPAGAEGNDNWVTYFFGKGTGKAKACIAPIGGNKPAGTATTTATSKAKHHAATRPTL